MLIATDLKVQAAIRTVCEQTGATVLVVAHRMKTLQDSEHLIVMSDGIVVEQGVPQELEANGGFYASMVSQPPLNGRVSDLRPTVTPATDLGL